MSSVQWRTQSCRGGYNSTSDYRLLNTESMLSRVANSLYWMSRYIERAENIARIVDVNLQLLLDLRDLNETRLAEHWLPIVQTTGDEKQFFALHPKATAQAVTEFLVFQPENPNSIVSSICQAREDARMVRDQITLALWEQLNHLYWFVKTPQRFLPANQSRLAPHHRAHGRDAHSQ